MISHSFWDSLPEIKNHYFPMGFPLILPFPYGFSYGFHQLDAHFPADLADLADRLEPLERAFRAVAERLNCRGPGSTAGAPVAGVVGRLGISHD